MHSSEPKQNLTLHFKTLLTLICPLVLSLSCAQVKIHDEQFWGINGMGATGVHTLTDEITHVDEKTWLSMSIGMIAETPEVFADIKKAFEQLCTMAGPNCTVEAQQQAAKMFRNIERAHGGPLVPTDTLPLLKAINKAKLMMKKPPMKAQDNFSFLPKETDPPTSRK